MSKKTCYTCREYKDVRYFSVPHGKNCDDCMRTIADKARRNPGSGRTEKEIWDDFRENGFQ